MHQNRSRAASGGYGEDSAVQVRVMSRAAAAPRLCPKSVCCFRRLLFVLRLIFFVSCRFLVCGVCVVRGKIVGVFLLGCMHMYIRKYLLEYACATIYLPSDVPVIVYKEPPRGRLKTPINQPLDA